MPRSLPAVGPLHALLAAACLGAALSLLVLPAAPTYDPWAWLLWGRELWSLDLSTAEGPAFKPLPVAVCALLAPLGDVAPDAWVLFARAGALAAVLLAGALAWRLAAPPDPTTARTRDHSRARAASAVLAAVAVLLTAGFVRLSAAGSSEGLLLAFALGALLAGLDQRWRLALGLLAACCLLRVEAWPFALAAAALRWRAAAPGERAVLVAGGLAIPALWFGPEWLGSGDPLRSGDRARVPNPGQPALADVPALAAVRAAAALAFIPVGAAVLAARGRALVPAAIGMAWILLVAVMAQVGFSGESRYALPGVALVAVTGAAGLARVIAPRPWVLAAVGVAVLIAAAPRVDGLARDRAALTYQAELRRDLANAVADAGGPAALARCGRPVAGPYRGPLVAWHLRVEKRRVAFRPAVAGVILASALRHGDPREPAAPAGARTVAAAGSWRIAVRCGASRDAS
jgi:hypothetical protein